MVRVVEVVPAVVDPEGVLPFDVDDGGHGHHFTLSAQ